MDLRTDNELDVTDDAFLGGALNILQPTQGYRAGIDAVLLAAAVPSDRRRVLDVGAGVGTAGLCVARRLPQTSVLLADRQSELVTMACENARRNGLSDRVSAGIVDVLSDAGVIEPASFDCVISNPPFHDSEAGTLSPKPLKRDAHAMPSEALERWCTFAARMVSQSGTVILIHKTEALADLVRAMPPVLGSLVVLPIAPRTGRPASRVILRAIRGGRAPLVLLPPFVLHGNGHAYTAFADAILRRGAAIDF